MSSHYSPPREVEAGSPTDQTASILQLSSDLRRRKFRDDRGLMWIEGPRAFHSANANGWFLRSLVYCRRLARSSAMRRYVTEQRAEGVPVASVSPEVFRSISLLPRASGIAAIVRQRWTRLNRITLQPHDHIVVVEHLRSSGNLGTILRTADAVGSKAVVFVGPLSDPFSPTTVRSSMGSVFAMPVVRTSADRFRIWAKRQSLHCLGLSPEAKPVWEVERPASPIALMVGEERKGLSDTMRSLCNNSVALPMSGSADSLNVAVATGVMLYELARGRFAIASN